MRNILFSLFILLLLSSCGEQLSNIEPSAPKETAQQKFRFNHSPIDLTSKADSLVGAWPEFMAYEAGLDIASRATTTQDLKLALEQLSDQEFKLENSIFPASFNVPQIKSRLRVLRTFILQTEGAIAKNDSLQEPINKLLKADNQLRRQLNITLKIEENEKVVLENSN